MTWSRSSVWTIGWWIWVLLGVRCWIVSRFYRPFFLAIRPVGESEAMEMHSRGLPDTDCEPNSGRLLTHLGLPDSISYRAERETRTTNCSVCDDEV